MPEMSTAARTLALLDLLQTHRYWTGTQLAERLGVSGRTLRRDIDRLRDLGYRVSAQRGSDGGYLLESGSQLPPMVFSDGEAVAIAVGLGTAASSTAVTGLDELALSALAKVEQVLPAPLRRRVGALRAATVPSAPLTGDEVDPEVLAVLALACRDGERLRCRYTAADGALSRRQIEPVKLVPRDHRWYLVCWDLDRTDWRTFRVDRVSHLIPTGVRFRARPLPVEDVTAFVDQQFTAPPVYTARILIDAPIAVTTAYLAGYVRNLEPEGDRTSWSISDARLEVLAGALVWLPWPFRILESPELADLVRATAHRFLGAAAPEPEPVRG